MFEIDKTPIIFDWDDTIVDWNSVDKGEVIFAMFAKNGLSIEEKFKSIVSSKSDSSEDQKNYRDFILKIIELSLRLLQIKDKVTDLNLNALPDSVDGVSEKDIKGLKKLLEKIKNGKEKISLPEGSLLNNDILKPSALFESLKITNDKYESIVESKAQPYSKTASIEFLVHITQDKKQLIKEVLQRTYRVDVAKKVKFFDGVEDFIKNLKKDGFKIAIASKKGQQDFADEARIIFNEHPETANAFAIKEGVKIEDGEEYDAIAEKFHIYVDNSTEKGKPNAFTLKEAISSLGVAGGSCTSLMIGDRCDSDGLALINLIKEKADDEGIFFHFDPNGNKAKDIEAFDKYVKDNGDLKVWRIHSRSWEDISALVTAIKEKKVKLDDVKKLAKLGCDAKAIKHVLTNDGLYMIRAKEREWVNNNQGSIDYDFKETGLFDVTYIDLTQAGERNQFYKNDSNKSLVYKGKLYEVGAHICQKTEDGFKFLFIKDKRGYSNVVGRVDAHNDSIVGENYKLFNAVLEKLGCNEPFYSDDKIIKALKKADNVSERILDAIVVMGAIRELEEEAQVTITNDNLPDFKIYSADRPIKEGVYVRNKKPSTKGRYLTTVGCNVIFDINGKDSSIQDLLTVGGTKGISKSQEGEGIEGVLVATIDAKTKDVTDIETSRGDVVAATIAPVTKEVIDDIIKYSDVIISPSSKLSSTAGKNLKSNNSDNDKSPYK